MRGSPLGVGSDLGGSVRYVNYSGQIKVDSQSPCCVQRAVWLQRLMAPNALSVGVIAYGSSH